jgi:hypothetical protein
MNIDSAGEFRNAKNILLETFGNVYQVFDQSNHLTQYTFSGLLSQRVYKEYIRRVITTTDDVSYLESGFAVQISGYPMLKQEVIEAEPHVLQNNIAYWTIYTKRDTDPIQRVIQSLPRY